MMRRTIAVLAGLLMLAGLAMLPSTAGAQETPPEFTVPPTVSPSSTVPPARPTSTTRPTPPSTRPPAVLPDETETDTETETETEVVSPQDTRPGAQPEVKGDVVSRPLPRTGNDISGTAVFGGALTILGVAIALGARKRRNSFDGA